MGIDFQQIMLTKSDKQLQDYINDREIYTKEAIEAALAEIQKRGNEFSAEEISTIMKRFDKPKIHTVKNDVVVKKGWKKNIVEDLDAPQLYSETVIYVFSILFSVLFGSILLALNFKKLQIKKKALEVALFGLIFTAFQIYILSLIPRNTGLSIGFSAGGGAILNYYYWRKFIGENTKYRTKPFWIPLTIAIIISAIFIYIMILGDSIDQ